MFKLPNEPSKNNERYHKWTSKWLNKQHATEGNSSLLTEIMPNQPQKSGKFLWIMCEIITFKIALPVPICYH